jgi:magnesium-transporting ATPase (P-type)
LNARSETTSAFHNLFVNGSLWGAIVLSVVLQIAVVHVPILNVAFDTVPLTAPQWAFCLLAGSGVLAFGELRKVALRS